MADWDEMMREANLKTEALKAKVEKAKADLKALIVLMNPDPTKVKLEEVVAHLIQIEIILGLR